MLTAYIIFAIVILHLAGGLAWALYKISGPGRSGKEKKKG